MDFLSREGSPISAELWSKIDDQVISMAKKFLWEEDFYIFTDHWEQECRA